MELFNFLPILIASVFFLVLGIRRYKSVRTLADFLPIAKGAGARVSSSGEFSASTVATTVSLATIVAAYFNLASFFGLWLLWTAVTGAAGVFVVYAFSSRISQKLQSYDFVPTIHEFLATEYGRPSLKQMAALLTVVGLLLLLATEIIVGSKFLAIVMPSIPTWTITMGIAFVALAYVILGGFSTVILTERIQMWLIWLMIPTLALAIYFASQASGRTIQEGITEAIWLKPIDSSLTWFLVGILLMNVPTHLCSITMWQRAAACVDGNILKSGLLRSSVGVLFSWGFLVMIAWIAVNCIQANDGVGVFKSIIDHASKSFLGNIFSFLVLLGLYSALLSTASTLLIAIAHTVTTDIFPTHNQSKGNGLAIARVSVVVGSVFSCVFVAILSSFGFNIEDLIFSIYGGALALFPPVLLALLRPRSELRRLDRFAVFAVMGGFSAGWFVAFYGKINDVQNLVFMSPAIGMGISALVLIIGVTISAGRKAGHSDT